MSPANIPISGAAFFPLNGVGTRNAEEIAPTRFAAAVFCCLCYRDRRRRLRRSLQSAVVRLMVSNEAHSVAALRGGSLSAVTAA